MSKALAVLKLFFSLVSINSTETPPTTDVINPNSTIPITQPPRLPQPLLLKPMDQVAAFVGQAFYFTIPDDTFYPTYNEKTPESNLYLTMWTKNGGQIAPTSWLRFSSAEREVYGFPLEGNEGVFEYLVLARNKQGKSARDLLKFDVKANKGQYNHEFVMTIEFNLVHFIANIVERYDFISRVSTYITDDDVSAVWLKSLDEENKQITISLNTVPYAPCDKKQLQNILSKLSSDAGVVRPSFQHALSEKFPISKVKMNYLGICKDGLGDGDPGFQWGWLRHLLPVFMLMGVVGIPVMISCIIHKQIAKRRLRTRGQGRRRKEEEGTDFTFHTVHFNNRYPSMLSMSNNSKEDEGGDEDNSKDNTNLRVSIPNGSPPCMHLSVPNASQKIQNVTPNEDPTKVKNTQKGRTVYMGKSAMNIPVYFTQPELEEDKPIIDISFAELAESISSKLKGIGKSVMNVAGAGEEEAKAANIEGDFVVFESEIQLPGPDGTSNTGVPDIQSAGLIATGRRKKRITKRSQSEMRLSDHAIREAHDTVRSLNEFSEPANIKGTLMSSRGSRVPTRGISMPHIAVDSEYANDMNYTVQDTYNNMDIKPLKSALRRDNNISGICENDFIDDEVFLEEPNEPVTITDYTEYIEKLSRDANQEFGTGEEQLLADGYDQEVINEDGIVSTVEDRHRSLPVESFSATDLQDGRHTRQVSSDEHEYQESSEDEYAEETELEAMDYTTWRLRQIRKAERKAKKGASSHELQHDVALDEDSSTKKMYQEYTNPYQFANGPLRPPVRSQSSYGVLEKSCSSSDFADWTEDYEKENRYKQQPPEHDGFAHITQSMPSGLDKRKKFGQRMMGNHTGGNIDNRHAASQDRSLLGSIFSRDKTTPNDKNVNQASGATVQEEGSLVGFFKTRVSGFLGSSDGAAAGPSSSSSSWFK